MKKTKQILSVFLALLMTISVIPMSSITASAATFNDINQSSVFVKQQTNVTCTLASAVMMVRRAAMLTGNTNWASITESAMMNTAWLNGTGLLWSFSYAGISVAHATLPTGSSNYSTIINLLLEHPEGIVLYNRNAPHAILLTDYTNGVFYCSDPGIRTEGRIPISNASYVTIENATDYWYVSSPDCNFITYTEKPTNLKVTANHTSVAVGETVTFTFSADYAEELWFGLHDENGFIYGDRFYTNSTTYTFDKAGEYRANIEAKNNIGSIQSEYIYINVYDSVPSDCKISVDNDAINVGEEVIFNLSSKNANSHWIGIHKEDDTLVYESEAGNFIKYTFNEPGIYYADFDAINGYGTTRSNKVWFTVGKYEIIYNSNGGENAPDSQSKKYDENITISSTKPTRDGYTFLGWSTNKNAPVAEYSAGSIYSKNEGVILYAVWQKNPVTVSSISIATKPTKTEYYVGDTFDSSGLTIKATMSDGTTKTLTAGFTVSSPNMSTTGAKTVTVTHSGKTATFTINVKEMPVKPDIPNNDLSINIQRPSRTTIRHNDGIILHANIEGELPENTSVVWYISNDNFDAGYLDDGMSCVFVSKNNGYTTIYAVIEDTDGNELAVDSIELRSKAGFFDKIGGFFRSLFGSTKIYEN